MNEYWPNAKGEKIVYLMQKGMKISLCAPSSPHPEYLKNLLTLTFPPGYKVKTAV